jgi:hypothetical protein
LRADTDRNHQRDYWNNVRDHEWDDWNDWDHQRDHRWHDRDNVRYDRDHQWHDLRHDRDDVRYDRDHRNNQWHHRLERLDRLDRRWRYGLCRQRGSHADRDDGDRNFR